MPIAQERLQSLINVCQNTNERIDMLRNQARVSLHNFQVALADDDLDDKQKLEAIIEEYKYMQHYAGIVTEVHVDELRIVHEENKHFTLNAARNERNRVAMANRRRMARYASGE